jgi:predicted nucleic acid-binding protein
VKYLVDANVVSEATRPLPDGRVLDWLRANEAQLVLTPIVLGEIEYGILVLAPGRQRRLLQEWFEQRVRNMVVLDFDAATASEWAGLLARLKKNATPMPIKDSLIAASALRHGLTVATRNVADFRKSNVPVVNPFGA